MKRNVFLLLLITSCFLTGCGSLNNYISNETPKVEDIVSEERLAEIREIKNRFQNYQDDLVCTICDGTEFITSSPFGNGYVTTKYGTADIKICKKCGHIELFQSFNLNIITDEEYSFDEWKIIE